MQSWKISTVKVKKGAITNVFQSLTKSSVCPPILISAIRLPTAVPWLSVGNYSNTQQPPPQSVRISAFNIPSCPDSFCHLCFPLATLVACNAIAPWGQDEAPAFVSHVIQSFLWSVTLPKKINCSISSHQEIPLVSMVRKNPLATPTSIKSCKVSFGNKTESFR